MQNIPKNLKKQGESLCLTEGLFEVLGANGIRV